MYIDTGLQIDDSLDMGTSAASWYADGAVDLALAGRDVGKGRQMFLAITVTEAFVDASAASTSTFSLVEDAETGIDGSSIIVLSTEGFLVAALTLGTQIVIPVPPGIALQYLGLKVVVTQDLTAGIVSAQIVLEAQTN